MPLHYDNSSRQRLEMHAFAHGPFPEQENDLAELVEGSSWIEPFAERCLLRSLTQREIESIRQGLCIDFITQKVESFRDSRDANILFYIFLFQSIGDIVANEPIVRYLKMLAPTGIVHWIVNRNFKSILESNPYIDEVIPVNDFAEGEISLFRGIKTFWQHNCMLPF